ncbi:hypothetical protein Tco_0224103 [Tanacetum coccineum]
MNELPCSTQYMRLTIEITFEQDDSKFCSTITSILSQVGIDSGVENESSPLVNAKFMNNSQEVQEESNGDSSFQNGSNMHNGGSILGLMEDMIRVGQAMGYTMDGYAMDIEHIIGTQGADGVLK